MIAPIFKPDWRTQNRLKRRIYAKYMTWLERSGYVLVVCLLSMFVGSFFYRVDDYVSAEAVPLQAVVTSIPTKEEVLVVKVLKQDYEDVEAGAPLMQVIRGEEAIKRFLSGSSLPSPEMIKAETAGTFHTTAKDGDKIPADGELAQLLDYTALEAKGSFKGETVGRAKLGQPARISGIAINTGDTIFRGESPQGTIYSRSVVGEQVQAALQESLKGKTLKLRDDAPLQVSEVTGVEIDAEVAAKSAQDPGVVLDPQTSATLTGKVTAGTQKAEVQIANLPSEARAAATKALNDSLVGKRVGQPDGGALEIDAVDKSRFVVKAKATLSEDDAAGISASPLSRSYAATIRLDNAPAYLRDKVRAADKLGKTVTAKVEIRTGDRPIAFILLRRS